PCPVRRRRALRARERRDPGGTPRSARAEPGCPMTPRPSRFALGLFRTVFLPWMRGRVIVRIPHVPWNVPRDAPLLLVANHISWWDGFALWEVQRMLRPGASLRVVMTAAELERNRVLGWIAAVPIRPGSAGSVLRTFRELRRL